MQTVVLQSVSVPFAAAAKALLGPGDFTLLGSYPFTAANGASYGMGLTCRRVNGQLRFLTFRNSGGSPSPGSPAAILIEFTLPSAGVGHPITSLVQTYPDVWDPLSGPGPNVQAGDEYGIDWEDQGNGNDGVGRLWASRCNDYPQGSSAQTNGNSPYGISTRTLASNGTAVVSGEWGFTGIGRRAIYGGMTKVPAWAQAQYGLGPYLFGWGGYTSLMEGFASGVPSLGFMAVSAPDVTTYPAGTALPTTAFTVVADHRSGTTAQHDWYTAPGEPTTFDRGQRNVNVANYYDGGDTRTNPTTRPTVPPAAAPVGNWLSPAPDGAGRWTWGDSYWNTGVWIDGPNKSGLVALATVAHGDAWYAGSTLHCDSRDVELHFFDPASLGAVVAGTIQPWNVQPASSKLLTGDMTPLGLCYGVQGMNATGGAGGACFDPVGKVLYVWSPMVNGNAANGSMLLAYSVNC